MISSQRRFKVKPTQRWIVAVLLFILTAVPACAGIGDDPGGPDAQTLRLAGAAFGISTIDPALVRDVDTAFIARQVFSGLVQLNSDLEPEPDLAEEIQVLDGGSRYRFRIHENLTFHDGKPLDAGAIARSFNRASDPGLAGGTGASLPASTYFSDIFGIDERLSGAASTISGIKVFDERTIDFVLKQPTATFLMKLSGSPALVVDVDNTTGAEWWANANGSGPFKLARYDAGAELELVRFDGYHAGALQLERVTIALGERALQPLNQYESGELDITAAPGGALDRIQSSSDPFHAHLVERAQLSTTFMAFNPNVEPFDDPDVRRMIASAFDVERYVELSLEGRVQRAEGMIPPGVWGREWPAAPIPYDLEQAQRLRDGLSSDLARAAIVEPGASVSSVVSTLLWHDLEFELIAIDQPWPEFTRQLPTGRLPAFVLTWVADYPDPENTLAALLRTGSPDNYLAYSNPEFDALVEQAAREMDDDVRQGLYLAAQQVAVDDAVVIPLYHGMSYTLVQPWVRGLEITEIGILGLEDVWIESESS